MLCTQARLTARRDLHTQVLILSRHHGLIGPGTLIEPYEQPRERSAALAPHTLAEQLTDIVDEHLHVTITAYTTRANVGLLSAAIAKVNTGAILALGAAFATAHGIGDQNKVVSQLRREQKQRMAEYEWHV
ncbi:hypothetical protein KUTG_09971 [Kutzneria sp. 744]|nr:hypothetical protein KUTG_09971 [Kutzneria sp. 744]